MVEFASPGTLLSSDRNLVIDWQLPRVFKNIIVFKYCDQIDYTAVPEVLVIKCCIGWV